MTNKCHRFVIPDVIIISIEIVLASSDKAADAVVISAQSYRFTHNDLNIKEVVEVRAQRSHRAMIWRNRKYSTTLIPPCTLQRRACIITEFRGADSQGVDDSIPKPERDWYWETSSFAASHSLFGDRFRKTEVNGANRDPTRNRTHRGVALQPSIARTFACHQWLQLPAGGRSDLFGEHPGRPASLDAKQWAALGCDLPRV